ncbi:hypothetical protein ACQKC7_02740 [Pseudoalteromonas tetraodonis]|uniref:hypothetical protein n=1 Tax=Pseudoalteromonas tetraodonis TaxID=43659 RepID=UPI003D0372AB
MAFVTALQNYCQTLFARYFGVSHKEHKGIIVSHKKVEITEYNYTEKLGKSYFNISDINPSVSCTNLLCNNPNVAAKFDVAQFSCEGKESTGRDCKRLFEVKLIN